MIPAICIPLMILIAFSLWGKGRMRVELDRTRSELRGEAGIGTAREANVFDVSRLSGKVSVVLGRLFEKVSFLRPIRARAEALGPHTWERLASLWFSVSLLLLLFVTALFQSAVLTTAAALSTPFLPLPILDHWEKRHRRRMRDETRHFITLVSGTLRCGLSLPLSFMEALSDIRQPLRGKIARFLEAVEMGQSLDSALVELGAEIDDPDLDFLLVALLTVRSTGGDLAVVMTEIEDTIRKRIDLDEEVRSLTAQGRASGLIVAALPLLFLMLLFIVSRDSIRVLTTTPVGLVILFAGIILQLMGFFWIKRMTGSVER